VTLKNYDDEVIADASKDEHSDEAHGEDEHSDEAHGEDEHSDEAHDDHGHEGGDPHFLSDPETMKQMVPELVEALEEVTGKDLTAEEESLLQYFESTHSEVLSVMGALGNTPCTLVTGHQSLRYFASRYQCEIVGAIIPSGSSTAEATAGELADLREVAEQADVRAIFVDEGTPTNVANQIASEIGVEVHELASHTVPDSGGYKEYVVALANAIVEGLTTE
jgi:zinc/manganese transport system substrate-binding protein